MWLYIIEFFYFHHLPYPIFPGIKSLSHFSCTNVHFDADEKPTCTLYLLVNNVINLTAGVVSNDVTVRCYIKTAVVFLLMHSSVICLFTFVIASNIFTHHSLYCNHIPARYILSLLCWNGKHSKLFTPEDTMQLPVWCGTLRMHLFMYV